MCLAKKLVFLASLIPLTSTFASEEKNHPNKFMQIKLDTPSPVLQALNSNPETVKMLKPSETDEFMENSQRIILEISRIVSKDNSHPYVKINNLCGSSRQQLAKKRNRNHTEWFGKGRFESGSTAVTQIGNDPYLKWRYQGVSIFREFFEILAESTEEIKDIRIDRGNDFYTKFKFHEQFDPGRYRETIQHLKSELQLNNNLTRLACDQLFTSFPPGTDPLPKAEDLSVASVNMFFKGKKIGIFLIAVETFNASSSQELAKNALLTLNKKIDGSRCGLLYIHSDVEVGKFLSDIAKETFEKITSNIGSSEYKKPQLLEDLGKLRWLKSHAQEFMRGTPTIAEWMERGLAHSHGFELLRSIKWTDEKFQNRDLADLYALSMSLDEFCKVYISNTDLQKIQDT